MDGARIPERVVHAKGYGAHGYFEVTHDVSKYTAADVYNGIGKKTPVFGRFSTSIHNLGGSEVTTRDTKGLSLKYYTREGNLDHLCLHHPVYLYQDPSKFAHFLRAERRNPKTNMFDATMAWDFRTLHPTALHGILWLLSEYGNPDGYRKMDIFPIHTYEIYNKQGERFYVRFNYRTEQGLANLTTAEAMAIGSQDPDYYTRDLYNAIANKNYPSWRLEMDVIPFHGLKKLNYDPFDFTKLWNKGTYHTVTIGRLVFNRIPDNDFRDTEQVALNPANLVPGISGPPDLLFTGRVVAYRDAQDYRLGRNHNNILINRPKYAKNYLRNSVPPVLENMKDAPIYYLNSFNGPMPYVDTSAPKEKVLILQSNAVDLGNAAYFYNHVLRNEAQREVVATNAAASLVTVVPSIAERVIKLMSLINPTLGARIEATLKELQARTETYHGKPIAATKESYAPLARCMELFSEGRLETCIKGRCP